MSLAIMEKKSSNIGDLKLYRPNIKLNISKDPYTLKTVETQAELHEALRLRAEVFFEDPSHPHHGEELDFDDYDSTCDHIIIVDNRINTIVGTYRIRTTKFNRDFYSEGEFNIESVLDLDSGKMELGRACVKQGHRSGSIISLLWRGIARYAMRSESKYLFGCSSVFTTEAKEAAEIYYYLKRKGHISDSCNAYPTDAYKFRKFESFVRFVEAHYDEANDEATKAKIPTLFQSYLKSGAVVCGEPAVDMDFDCIDFLTVLNLEKLSKLFARRYQDE